jgi:hypothetical protein
MQEKAPMPNKVSLSDMMAKIKSTTYTLLPNGRTTICQVTLENGFTVEGSSACVDIANYNQALGEKYSFEKTVDKMWELEGYLLAEKIYQSTKE